jgi:type 1 glutamine amidotransferase
MGRRVLAAAILAALVATGVACGAGDSRASRPDRPELLVVTEARRYVHASIPDAVAALRRLARRSGAYDAVVVGAADQLTAGRLAHARAVAFAQTTGELHTSPAQRAALLAFVRRGGGFVGLHSASATYRRWPAFHRMLGATFLRHPPAGPGRVLVEDRASPIMRGLPASYRVRDELYEFTRDPRCCSHVLARLATGRRGPDRPLIWCRRYGRGRVFYDALGHFPARWRAPDTVRIVGAGVRWALGLLAAPRCG